MSEYSRSMPAEAEEEWTVRSKHVEEASDAVDERWTKHRCKRETRPDSTCTSQPSQQSQHANKPAIPNEPTNYAVHVCLLLG